MTAKIKLPLVVRAMEMATRAHEDQKYGNRMYFYHVKDVVRTLQLYGITDPDMLAAGYLHDTIEDTNISREDIEKAISVRVADLVHAVTNEPGGNRKERNKKTYPKIKRVPGATILKLADRISNVDNCWKTRDARLFMYKKEYFQFRWTLRNPADPSAKPLWNRLDELLGWWEPGQ